MIGERKLRVARKEYTCSERSYHKIKVGDVYLFESAPPWHEMARVKGKWMVSRACVRCAKEYGLLDSDMRKQLEMGNEEVSSSRDGVRD